MVALSSDTQAALLLCAHFGQRDEVLRPLTTRQYGIVAKWLIENSLRPGDLLGESGRSRLHDFNLGELTGESLVRLLDRGAALGLMTERWASRGIWIVSRADSDYPPRIKSYLQQSAPPLFFGVGNQDLLRTSGIAVTGSRYATEEDLDFARRLGSECASQGLGVISGAAKGVDTESMMFAIEHGGTSVGVLAEGLARVSIAPEYHDAIADGRLALISALEPESRWFAHNAMERNKLIYGLSEAAVVVSSSVEKGGTWTGAVEALKHRRVPVYAKASGIVAEGNARLLRIGARAFPDIAWNDLRGLFEKSPTISPLFEQSLENRGSNGDGLSGNGLRDDAVVGGGQLRSDEPIQTHSRTKGAEFEHSISEAVGPTGEDIRDRNQECSSKVARGLDTNDAYLLVEELLLRILDRPVDEKAVAEALRIVPAQSKAWLKRAVEEGKVRKMTKPTRYRKSEIPGLFQDDRSQ